MNIKAELAALGRMTTGELAGRHAELTGPTGVDAASGVPDPQSAHSGEKSGPLGGRDGTCRLKGMPGGPAR